MFVKRAVLSVFAALWALACAPVTLDATQKIAPNVPVGSLAAACAGRDGWADPAPPARIFANIHYVGTCGITALLITSDAGHVLIDGATAEAAPAIAANIVGLGYKLSDVRMILNSHEHVDHAGGLAELQRLTGAPVATRLPARPVLESGVADPADPQAGALPSFAGIRVGRALADGETVRVGPIALTAHATPGHTPGSTSWTWQACEGSSCRSIAFADSLTAISGPTYRFGNHPAYVTAFRTSIAKIAAFDCDILITPHPGASNLFARIDGDSSLLDPQACATYAAGATKRLDARLGQEAASPK